MDLQTKEINKSHQNFEIRKYFNAKEQQQLKELKINLSDYNKDQVLKRCRELIAINTSNRREYSKGNITCERMVKIKLIQKLELLMSSSK